MKNSPLALASTTGRLITCERGQTQSTHSLEGRTWQRNGNPGILVHGLDGCRSCPEGSYWSACHRHWIRKVAAWRA